MPGDGLGRRPVRHRGPDGSERREERGGAVHRGGVAEEELVRDLDAHLLRADAGPDGAGLRRPALQEPGADRQVGPHAHDEVVGLSGPLLGPALQLVAGVDPVEQRARPPGLGLLAEQDGGRLDAEERRLVLRVVLDHDGPAPVGGPDGLLGDGPGAGLEPGGGRREPLPEGGEVRGAAVHQVGPHRVRQPAVVRVVGHPDVGPGVDEDVRVVRLDQVLDDGGRGSPEPAHLTGDAYGDSHAADGTRHDAHPPDGGRRAVDFMSVG